MIRPDLMPVDMPGCGCRVHLTVAMRLVDEPAPPGWLGQLRLIVDRPLLEQALRVHARTCPL